jgi:mono/diheme cytochrome c family protein
MIPQTHLPEDDRKAVVAYIKTLSPRFKEEAPEAPISIPPTPIQSAGVVEKGRNVYDAAQCWECHGREGRGDGPSARQLRDDWGLPILPTDLTRRPRKSGQMPLDLYRTIATGLNGTPMPSYFDSLSPDEIWSLVAYLESLPPASEAKNLSRAVGEEQGGIMAERMHGSLGRRNPFGP